MLPFLEFVFYFSIHKPRFVMVNDRSVQENFFTDYISAYLLNVGGFNSLSVTWSVKLSVRTISSLNLYQSKGVPRL